MVLLGGKVIHQCSGFDMLRLLVVQVNATLRSQLHRTNSFQSSAGPQLISWWSYKYSFPETQSP